MSEHDTELNSLSAHTHFIFADRLVATAVRRNVESWYFLTFFILRANFNRE